MSTWLISTNGILLTAGNGLPSVGATPPPAATASFDVTVAKRSNLQVAPEAIYFEISNWSGFNTTGPAVGETRDERLHRIEYIWDFYYSGTDNSYAYTAPVNIYSGSARHTNGHKNSRYAYGFQASHTYREPGTYTVRVLGYEIGSGIIGEGTVEVTIGDPDTQFSGVNGTTIFVSATSTTTNQPAGSTLVTETNLTTLLNTYALNESNPVRIMYDWGETGTGTGLNNTDFNVLPSIHICSPGVGGGTAPSISSVGFNCFNDSTSDIGKDFHLYGVQITGTFSDGSDGTPSGSATLSVNTDIGSVLLDGVTISDRYFGVDLSGGSFASNLVTLNDTVIDNVDIGFSGGGGATTVAMTGSRITQNENASMLNFGGSGYTFRHNCRNYVIHSCDIYSRKTNSFSAIGGGGTVTYAQQPALRISANGNATNVRACVVASTLEGGGGVLVTSLGDSGTQNPANILIDKNYILGTYQTNNLIELFQDGQTIRNNVMQFPDVTQAANVLGAQAAVEVSNSDGSNTFVTDPGSSNEIYNNTIVNRLSATTVEVFSLVGDYTVVNNNNLTYEPNSTPADTTYTPLSTSSNVFTPRELGWFSDSTDLTSTTATPTTAGTTDVFAPETGSSAIGGATTGLVSMTDFYGRLRSDVMSGLTRTDESLGAIEVALES